VYNYYTILRVSEEASQEEIKASYRALAKEFHPDVNPDNAITEEYFKQVNEAYAVLKDPIRRNWYNLMLKGYIMFQPVDPRKYGTRYRYQGESESRSGSDEKEDTPFWLRQLVWSLAMAWGLLIIYNNWFTTYEGTEVIKMVFAFILFIVATYFYINNLYNKWRIKGTKFNPEARSLRYFLCIFFLTVPAFFALGYARKTIQLKIYPYVTQGTVIEWHQRTGNVWINVLYFDEKNLSYHKDLTFKSATPLSLNDFKVMVKFSRLEPRIMQYNIKLTGRYSVLQQDIDRLNEGGDYFKPETN
jgi:hypothetical protein